ncbi:MAG TPA: hypothetical protein VGE04_18400 [Chloroflexia bacterium]|jgi:hypothetical protein
MKRIVRGLFVLVLLLTAACDSGAPGGGPLPSSPQAATTLASPYDVPATFTALSIVGSASKTPVTFEDMKQSPDLDACLYLTGEDVRAVFSKPFEQSKRNPNDTLASCTYSGDANYFTLTIYRLDSEAQTAQLSGYNIEFIQKRPDYGEFVPGIGDAATLERLFSGRPPSQEELKLEDQVGWQMSISKERTYLVLKWYSDRIEEKETILDLAWKVVSRF